MFVFVIACNKKPYGNGVEDEAELKQLFLNIPYINSRFSSINYCGMVLVIAEVDV